MLAWNAKQAALRPLMASRRQSRHLQRVHPLQVPGQRDQVPLVADMAHSAQQELTEFHHVFYDAEYRLDGLLAQCIDRTAGSALTA